MKQYHEIVAEIRKQMYLRDWKTKDLAEATGYTVGTIRVMLTNPKKMSDKSLAKICEALQIKL
ncbi:helix-turn-helix domain-containing protein [Clostridium aminobutyricum]|uniref:Helix-turn-helix transcriptional regulator n=1 Tax=Clostridium aminobutyricum TaxID=33953 RepID=A0A939D940_CLOAM|nr:helix-turn-helix transcriptional regulator [Clostridium aminobutyricum]